MPFSRQNSGLRLPDIRPMRSTSDPAPVNQAEITAYRTGAAKWEYLTDKNISVYVFFSNINVMISPSRSTKNRRSR
jgi:hypothetical protein